MMKIYILLLCLIFNIGFAQAKTEDPTSDVIPISAYGTYNGTILPIKVASDGTVVTSGSGTGTGSGTINAGTVTHIPTYSASTTVSDSKVAITSPSTLATMIFGTDASSLTFQGTGTVVNRDSTDTFTNKTFDTVDTGNSFKINGTSITSISGNTAKVGTTNGSLISGNCAKFDANGNIVDNGSTCGAGGGSGTVTSSTSGRPAYYPSSSNTVTGFIYQFYSTVNNSSSGVDNPVSIPFTVNNSGTAGYTALKINVTETTTGSGLRFLQDWQVAGTSKASVDSTGAFIATSLTTSGTPAGLLQLKQPSANGSNYVGLQGRTTLNSSSTITIGSPRVNTVTSSATPAINTDTTDLFTVTALATAITSMSSSLTGTANNGDSLKIRILDNGTARAITWGASFASRGPALPTTTVLSKYWYGSFIYNSTTITWDLVGASQEQ